MALTKVGTSAAASAFHIGAGGTVTVTFTADSTFAEGDFLLVCILGGAIDANQAYNTAPTDITPEADWYYFLDQGPLAQTSFSNAYATPFHHIVSADEAGESSLAYGFTLATVSTVDGIGTPGGVAAVGWLAAMGGVAVRGSEGPCSVKLEYVPNDNSDSDFVMFKLADANPFPAVTPYDTDWWSDSGGSILMYGDCISSKTSFTAPAANVTFTGPTELSDAAYYDAQESGATDWDLWAASAYRLLAADADWPADVVQRPSSGHEPTGEYAWRLLVVLDSVPGIPPEPSVAWPPPYEPISRKVTVKELPHEVSSRMFDDL
ncbi:MAG TPA: hypothetical protein VNN79_25445 [Actinomycetota bacterium]|nr:hypothetical protein [Actinomycetota bacterium]